MNPMLKKLRGRQLTARDLAELLKKHIGAGANEGHCHDAVDALHTIRDDVLREQAMNTAILFGGVGCDCDVIRNVIVMLEKLTRAERET
jgi:hypothetical protein